MFDCRPSTGVLRNTRRRRLWFSKPSASAYFITHDMRLWFRDYYASTNIRREKKCYLK